MIWQITIALCAICASLVWYKNRHFRKMVKLLKSDLPYWPLIGNAQIFIGSSEDRMNGLKISAKDAIAHDGISSLFLGNKYFAVIADPVIAETVLKSCLEKDKVMAFAKYVTGNGSIFAPVPIWRPRRKILAPTFSLKNLNMFVKIFSRKSSILVDLLETNTSQGPFSVWRYLTTYTMDSVCGTTLGVNMNAQKNPDQPFLQAFEDISNVVAHRFTHPWLHSDIAFNFFYGKRSRKARSCLWGFIDKVIKDKRKELKEKQKLIVENNNNENEPGMKSFLDLLIEGSGGEQGYTDKELQEEILVLVLAGTDTSAVGASFALCLLARHQMIQDQVHEEIYNVFGDSKRPLTAEDLPKLKFTEAVIKETLRLCPPVPITTRMVGEDVTLPSGVTLIKGTSIINSIWGIHRNAKYWGDDAEEFRPNRFIDQPLKHPAAYIPFSHGPRNCLGYQYAMLSMKTAIASILRRYKVLPAPGQLGPLRCTFEVMMKDADHFIIQLEKRS